MLSLSDTVIKMDIQDLFFFPIFESNTSMWKCITVQIKTISEDLSNLKFLQAEDQDSSTIIRNI